MSTEEKIFSLAKAVIADESVHGVLSTGERLAVAFVLDRPDLLEAYSMLEAIERLGPEWTRAALFVQRNFLPAPERAKMPRRA